MTTDTWVVIGIGLVVMLVFLLYVVITFDDKGDWP